MIAVGWSEPRFKADDTFRTGKNRLCNSAEKLRYRVFHSKTIFLRWLKMTLKYIVHIKETYFYNHKDSPFDMKHQLMSADPLPIVKIDLK